MRSLLNALLALFFAFALTPAARAQTLDTLLNSFDQRREQTDQGRDAQLKKLSASYTTALRRLLDRTKTSGDLDAVRPVNDEITAIEDQADSLPPLPDSAPAELKKLRATFDDARHKILKTHAATLTDLADKADAALQKLETDLTRAGQIDAAVAARRAREELANDQAITDARDLVNLGGSSAKGKPALQLRRHGDNLEVIVFYDRAGKISMDSPVENTRERTGDGKELGNTKATTLGEFVGAKGYTVDPYTAYEHKFDTKDLGGMTFARLEHKTAFAIENEKGVKVSVPAKQEMPQYTSFKDVLPAEFAPGAYRISVRYFIPKENRILTGLRFENVAGNWLGGSNLDRRAAWATAEVEADICKDPPILLIKPMRAAGAKPNEGQGEFFVISLLKVEHISFSAFVQKRFSDAGTPIDEQREAARQPAFVTNGRFTQQ